MMKKLSSREGMLFMVTAGLALTYMLIQWVGKPLLMQRNEGDDVVATRQSNVQQYHDRLHTLAGVEKAEQKLRDTFGMAGSEEQVVSRLVVDVQQKAEQQQVNILNLKPQQVTRRDGFMRFPLQMTVSGSWEGLMAWLDSLQRAPLHMSVTQLRLEPSPNENHGVKGRVRIEYFRLK